MHLPNLPLRYIKLFLDAKQSYNLLFYITLFIQVSTTNDKDGIVNDVSHIVVHKIILLNGCYYYSIYIYSYDDSSLYASSSFSLYIVISLNYFLYV